MEFNQIFAVIMFIVGCGVIPIGFAYYAGYKGKQYKKEKKLRESNHE